MILSKESPWETDWVAIEGSKLSCHLGIGLQDSVGQTLRVQGLSGVEEGDLGS